MVLQGASTQLRLYLLKAAHPSLVAPSVASALSIRAGPFLSRALVGKSHRTCGVFRMWIDGVTRAS